MTPPRTLLVIPCYNEEQRLPQQKILAFAQQHEDVRLLLVNDGSKDGTWGILEQLRARSGGRILTLNLEQNGGKAEAVRRGILAARAYDPEYIGFWDADLATPLRELPTFVAVLDRHPEINIVIGTRAQLLGRHIKRKLIRHYLGRLFATAASHYLRLEVYDTQCGAKLFRNTEDLPALFEKPFVSRWIFDVEILRRYLGVYRPRHGRRLRGAGIYEQPLRRWEDIGGSKVRGKDFVRALSDFARIVLTYR